MSGVTGERGTSTIAAPMMMESGMGLPPLVHLGFREGGV
jgi:hypothetical protein